MAQPIFQDAHGMAIKFFIQKDIPQEIQAEVCETIAVRILIEPFACLVAASIIDRAMTDVWLEWACRR